MKLLFLERMMGVDLRCGGGRVAALTCPRHVIHSRSRSTPSQTKNNSPIRNKIKTQHSERPKLSTRPKAAVRF